MKHMEWNREWNKKSEQCSTCTKNCALIGCCHEFSINFGKCTFYIYENVLAF